MVRQVQRQSQPQQQTQQQQQSEPEAGSKPLWNKAISVIGGTGEFESGKTTFGLTICPGPDTLYYDFENSGASYEADLNFTRIDVPGEMLKKFPQGGYKPVDVFNWWIGHVRSQAPGQYRVIMIDPASDIEQGMADWVFANPRYFNRTLSQYIKMSGLAWGDMKAYWKTILADIAARCETFYFTTHMASVWKGDRPSKERKAKGKETLFEMASLYLKFERKKDKNAIPSAVVLKSRLSKITINADSDDGEVVSVPLLPPRLPKATPAAIRRYMLNPPDYSNLTPDELIGEQVLTADEKLLLQAEIATANRDTAMVDHEREERQGQGNRLGRVTSRPAASTTDTEESEQDAGSNDPAQAGLEEEEEVTQVDDTAADETAAEEAPTVGEVLHEVQTSDRPAHYPPLDGLVSKPMLSALKRTIARFVAAGGQEEVIARGIKRRNHNAATEADLTQGQAEDLDSVLCKILDGPHETAEQPQPDPQPQQTQTSSSVTTNQPESEVKAKRPRTKRVGAAAS